MKTYDDWYADLQSLEQPFEKGGPFEALTLWFLRHDPVWSKELGLDKKPENAQLWKDAPSSWKWSRTDIGTDILVKDQRGDLWAVQAKGFREDRDVTKSDLDTFLADTNRSAIHGRILITSSGALARNAKTTIDGQEKQVHVITGDHLQEARMSWPPSIKALTDSDSRSRKRKPRRLRKHQARAIKVVVQAFQDPAVRRGQLLMACGTGKTLVGQRIAEQLDARTVLVLFPSLMLLGQTLRDWLSDASEGRDFDWIAVCSDSTVVSKDDQATQHVSDLGIPNVTTDPTHIRQFLTRRRRNGVPMKVVFSTYQSTDRIVEAVNGEHHFDLIINDEAHRMATVKGRSGRASDFTLALHDTNVPAKRRLFMTATPRIYGGAAKTKAHVDGENLLFSMDDPQVFGAILHHFSFRDAIRDEVLSDYQILGVVVTESEVQAHIETQSNLGLQVGTGKTVSVVDASSAAAHLAVAESMDDPSYEISSMISFHNTLKSATDFASEHNIYREGVGREAIHVATVKGTTPAKRRSEALEVLEAGQEKAIVTNARCLTEGIDIPTLGGVTFIDPRYSVIDIAQAVGRAVRKPSGQKKTGYIVVPVYLSQDLLNALMQEEIETNEIEQALQTGLNSAFAPMINLIHGIKSFDGMLVEQLNSFRTSRGKKKGTARKINLINVKTSKGYAHDQDSSILLDISGATPYVGGAGDALDLPADLTSLERFADALTSVCLTEVLNACTASWYERLGDLMSHCDEHQSIPSPTAKDPEIAKLGRWCVVQRTWKTKGWLQPEREASLDALPYWAWEPHDAKWEKRFKELSDFMQENQRMLKRSEGSALFSWVNTQRKCYKDGDLSPERIESLEGLKPFGFVWDEFEFKFEQQVQRYVAHWNLHGELPTKKTDKSLWSWVHVQRGYQRTGDLTPDRFDRLDALPGWEWEYVEPWWDDFENLVSFVKSHEGLYPSKLDNWDLFRWMHTQREHKKKGSLAADKVEAFETRLPGWKWTGRLKTTHSGRRKATP